jgi:hypothetical protein
LHEQPVSRFLGGSLSLRSTIIHAEGILEEIPVFSGSALFKTAGGLVSVGSTIINPKTQTIWMQLDF